MAKSRCDRLITAETSKEYLAGNLSAAEMYQVEYLMLENDFCFEGMEGLERVPWDRCQQAMESTSTRIRNQYNISSNERRKNTRLMAVALALALGGLGLFWAFNTPNEQTMDLSTPDQTMLPPTHTESLEQPTNERQVDQVPLEAGQSGDPVVDNSSNLENDNEKELPPVELENKTTAVEARSIPPSEPDRQQLDQPPPTHIAVGRVVDPKGLALSGVTVRVGDEISKTDQSGYYTLNLPSGKMLMTVLYMGTTSTTEVDSDQNWQIVLDVQEGRIIQSQALNSANRFK